MKIELHLHTDLKSPCAVASPREMLDRLVAAGYDAVFLTEHDAVWTDEELGLLRAEYPGIRIFPGMELHFTDVNRDVLVLGSNDPEYLLFASEDRVFAKARREGHLTVLAHPFRYLRGGALDLEGCLPDAVEYQTCNHGGKFAEQAERFAAEHALPMVNAGDVHSLEFINRHWIETRDPVKAPRGVREAILGRAYENRSR